MQELVNNNIIDTYQPDFSSKFSVVIPVNDDEVNFIEQIVTNVYEEVGKKIPLEIIISNDGSDHKIKGVIQQLSKKIPLKATLSSTKKTYGNRIIEGLHHVTSPFVFFLDSNSFNKPSDFWKLKEKLEECSDKKNIIISTYQDNIIDPFHRRIITKFFQELTSVVFDLPATISIASSIKLMEINIAKNIAKECKFMTESFWTEFIIRASSKKFKIFFVRNKEESRDEIIGFKKTKVSITIISQLRSIIKLKRELSRKGFVRSMLETKTVKQVLSMATIGGIGAGIVLLLTWFGVHFLNVNYMISAAVALEIGIVWAFFFNNRITFHSKQGSKLHHQFLKYNGVAFAGEGLNLLILYVLTESGLFYLISEAISILIVFGFNFILSKKLVWKD